MDAHTIGAVALTSLGAIGTLAGGVSLVILIRRHLDEKRAADAAPPSVTGFSSALKERQFAKTRAFVETYGQPPTGGSGRMPAPPLRIVLTTKADDAGIRPPVEPLRYYVRQFDGKWHVFDRYPGCDAFARHPVSIRTYSRKSAAVRGAERMNRK